MKAMMALGLFFLTTYAFSFEFSAREIVYSDDGIVSVISPLVIQDNREYFIRSPHVSGNDLCQQLGFEPYFSNISYVNYANVAEYSQAYKEAHDLPSLLKTLDMVVLDENLEIMEKQLQSQNIYIESIRCLSGQKQASSNFRSAIKKRSEVTVLKNPYYLEFSSGRRVFFVYLGTNEYILGSDEFQKDASDRKTHLTPINIEERLDAICQYFGYQQHVGRVKFYHPLSPLYIRHNHSLSANDDFGIGIVLDSDGTGRRGYWSTYPERLIREISCR